MRKILLLIAAMACAALISTSCRMAPADNLGDTVEAKYFEPIDTAVINQAKREKAKTAGLVTDSTNLFYVGSGSTSARLQLVSYPSRRDTAFYYKSKRIEVTGNADYEHVVRVGFSTTKTGDSIVVSVEEIQPQTTKYGKTT